jgi:hypothetical protein
MQSPHSPNSNYAMTVEITDRSLCGFESASLMSFTVTTTTTHSPTVESQIDFIGGTLAEALNGVHAPFIISTWEAHCEKFKTLSKAIQKLLDTPYLVY